MVFESHIDNELLNTLVCSQLFTGYPGARNLKFQRRFFVPCFINDLRSRKRRLFLELVRRKSHVNMNINAQQVILNAYISNNSSLYVLFTT